MSDRARRAASWTLLVVATIVLAVGALAWSLNDAVGDSDRFAARVNAVRHDPAVAAQAGQAAATELVALKPDLIAVKPLLEGVSTWVVGSSALDGAFQAAIRTAHRSVTSSEGNTLALRLVDLGAAVTGALSAMSPEVAQKIPPDLSITLSEIGSGDMLAPIVKAIDTVAVLAWTVPLAAVVLLVAAVFVSPIRRRGVLRAGGAALIASGVVGLVIVAIAAAAYVQPTSSLTGAFAHAAWREFRGALLVPFLVLGVGGLVLVAAAGALLPRFHVRALLQRTWQAATRTEARPGMGVLRALALVSVGIAAIVWPAIAAQVVLVVAGVLLVLVGMAEISRISDARMAAEAELGERIDAVPVRWLVPAGVGLAIAVLLGGGIALIARPAPDTTAVAAAAAVNDPEGPCNGHRELCDRRFDEVAFPAAHNAMSAADLPGWYLPEQPTSLVGALQAGVRVLLFDTWYGQPAAKGVITVPGDRDAAEAEARAKFGDATVDSALRVVGSLQSTPTGPTRPYMCHTLCELGATELAPAMAAVRAWMDAHPREVVTFFIQDVVTPADTAAILSRTGLADMAYTPQPGQPFPTLGQMADSGKRLLVLMENRGGGTEFPYLLQGFDWVQETPYTFKSAADFSCAANRGKPDAPLFEVNHWLAGFGSLVSDAAAVNAADVLGPRVQQCQAERGQIPNFVAVNYYNLGDVFGVVDRLNGLGGGSQ
ncbi:MAG: hypothetical protein E6Q90_06250 [Actinobacteria bacterium]|nr:MAG: hypothetical protein E6Q90_06250 [Actinomycetota bacterium]